MLILGINGAYHELSACLLKDGSLVCAVEEEKLTRIKHGKEALVDNPDMLPCQSIEYCLRKAGVTLAEIDAIGYSFKPSRRLRNIDCEAYVKGDGWGSPAGERLFFEKISLIPSKLSEMGGCDMNARFHWIDHHVCHAASSFFASPFEQAAILVMDGIAEHSTTWLGLGHSSQLDCLEELVYPDSIGFLWEKISMLLGFSCYDAAKIMGLAAYGDPLATLRKFDKIVSIDREGKFHIDNQITRFRSDDDFYPLEELFCIPRRARGSNLDPIHMDIAAGLQRITEIAVLKLAERLTERTGSRNLCFAGGVALNCCLNTVLMKCGLFDELYVQPAANDAGTALGAVLYLWHQRCGRKVRFLMNHCYWGLEYTNEDVEWAIKGSQFKETYTQDIAPIVARCIQRGLIVGLFQGALEWGPRALGNRSLLADPRDHEMRTRLNQRVKHREWFRPFGASVLAERVEEWFEVPECRSVSTGFMLFAVKVRKEKRKYIPAVLHSDYTCRIQVVSECTNPVHYRIMKEFEKLTGVPMVLNTSFNDNEPIVGSPQDAVKTFIRTDMDVLVFQDVIIEKEREAVTNRETAVWS